MSKKEMDSMESKKKWQDKADKLHKDLGDFRNRTREYESVVFFRSFSDKSDMGDRSTKTENVFNKEGLGQQDFSFLSFNVVKSCVEAVYNKLTRIKPKVTFLTKDSDRAKREVAKTLDNWALQILRKRGAYDVSKKAFLSAAVSGLGVVKVSKDKFSYVPIRELFFDNAFMGHSEPELCGEKKSLKRAKLIEMFKSKEADIKNEHPASDKMIECYEAYKKGKGHFIWTDKMVLLSEKWDKDLPYVFIRWQRATEGVIGVGIPQSLQAIHGAITYILNNIFDAVRLIAVPRIFVPKGSNPEEADITNKLGQIIEYQDSAGGKGVQFSTPPAISEQVIVILNLLWQRAYNEVGVNELTAMGRVPAGLDKASGTALRTYQQAESERFSAVRAEYEELFTGMIKKLIMLGVRPMDLSEKDVNTALQDISIWTSSLLPETITGRLSTINELINAGLLNKQQAFDLLDSPDVSRFISSQSSRSRAIELVIERALDKGEKPEFIPELGLDEYIDKARKQLSKVIIEGGEDKGQRGLLLDLLSDLDEAVSERNQAMSVDQGGPGTGMEQMGVGSPQGPVVLGDQGGQ